MDQTASRAIEEILAAATRHEEQGREATIDAIQTDTRHPRALVRYVLAARVRGQRPRTLGRYGLLEAIGHGAMGIVWLARDLELDRDVALKELSPQQCQNEEAVRRFRREAAAASRLSHPNLIPIHEIGREGDVWYYAMKFVSGSSLHEQVEMSQDTGMPGPAGQSPEELRRFLERYAAVADAVHVAHDAGILHRDIKPSNIMMDSDGTLLLVDFGLARDVDRQAMTLTGASLGTPMYMSPEQLAGRVHELDRRTDVYALGITLYEVLALRAPFSQSSLGEMAAQLLHRDPPTPRHLGVQLPPEVEHIIFRAIEKDPAKRYPTAAAFARDLRNYIGNRPIEARSQGPLVRLGKYARRHRGAVRTVLGTLLVLAALGLSGLGVHGCVREAQRTRYERSQEQYAAREYQRGREALAAGEPEQAQAIWAGAFASAPATESGRDAMIRFARTLLAEARPAPARRAAELVRRADPSRRQEAIALLLQARGALGSGDHGAALAYIEQCGARRSALPPEDRTDFVALERLATTYTRIRRLPCPEDGHVCIGRFRAQEPLLLVANGAQAHLMDLAEGKSLAHGLGGRPLRHEGRVYPPMTPFLAAADLDGDGVDELVRVSQHKMGHDVGRSVPEELEVLDLRTVPPTPKFRAQVPHGTYDIGVGDFDNDGIADILLGLSWPAMDHGIRLFRGTTVSTKAAKWHFEALPPARFGDLLPLRSKPSDIRSIRTGNLDLEPGNELAVLMDTHEDFSLSVFRYEDGHGFRRLAPPITVGTSMGAEFHDLDERPPEELLFGMYVHFAEGLDTTGWPPQGTYEATLGPSGDRLQLEGIARFGPLRLHPSYLPGPRPTNVGFSCVRLGSDPGGRRFVTARLDRRRGRTPERSMILCTPVSERRPIPFVLDSLPKRTLRIFVEALDVDGRKGDEIVCLVGQELRIYGNGVQPEPSRLSGDAQQPLSAGPTCAVAVADLLAELDFEVDAGRIYQAALPELRGAADERRAVLGSMRGLIKAGRLEEALEFLTREYARGSAFRIEIGLERARLLEVLGGPAEAEDAYEQILTSPGLLPRQRDEANRRRRGLTHLTKLRAKRIPSLDTAKPSRPGTFEVLEPRRVRIRDDRSDGAMLLTGVPWQGESFRLVANLRFRDLHHTQNVSIGFFAPDAADPIEHALCVRVASTSGQHRGVSLWRKQDALHWQHDGDLTPGLGLELDRWYRLELVHNRLLRESRLLVFDRDDGKRVMALETRELEAQPPATPWRFGIHASYFAVRGNRLDADVELVSLEMVD